MNSISPVNVRVWVKVRLAGSGGQRKLQDGRRQRGTSSAVILIAPTVTVTDQLDRLLIRPSARTLLSNNIHSIILNQARCQRVNDLKKLMEKYIEQRQYYSVKSDLFILSSALKLHVLM